MQVLKFLKSDRQCIGVSPGAREATGRRGLPDVADMGRRGAIGPLAQGNAEKSLPACNLNRSRAVESRESQIRTVGCVTRSMPVAASRPYWKGYLKLSLVSCPIALYSAASAQERVSFRQINRKTGNRLRQQLVDDATREPVDSPDKARGYEYMRRIPTSSSRTRKLRRSRSRATTRSRSTVSFRARRSTSAISRLLITLCRTTRSARTPSR
jgi:hypothetical protein